MPGLYLRNVLSHITQIRVVDAARSECRVNFGVDGDTPWISDEEGTAANITDAMERWALSVHTVHHCLTLLQFPTQQHKQQIAIRLHKVELVFFCGKGRTCCILLVLEMKIVSP